MNITKRLALGTAAVALALMTGSPAAGAQGQDPSGLEQQQQQQDEELERRHKREDDDLAKKHSRELEDFGDRHDARNQRALEELKKRQKREKEDQERRQKREKEDHERTQQRQREDAETPPDAEKQAERQEEDLKREQEREREDLERKHRRELEDFPGRHDARNQRALQELLKRQKREWQDLLDRQKRERQDLERRHRLMRKLAPSTVDVLIGGVVVRAADWNRDGRVDAMLAGTVARWRVGIIKALQWVDDGDGRLERGELTCGQRTTLPMTRDIAGLGQQARSALGWEPKRGSRRRGLCGYQEFRRQEHRRMILEVLRNMRLGTPSLPDDETAQPQQQAQSAPAPAQSVEQQNVHDPAPDAQESEGKDPPADCDIDGDGEKETIGRDANQHANTSYGVQEGADGDADLDRVVIGSKDGSEAVDTGNVDNDPRDCEIIVTDPSLPPTNSYGLDLDGDGDPDVIVVGTQGGATYKGLADTDHDPTEKEVQIDDPSQHSGSLNSANVDGDKVDQRSGEYDKDPDVNVRGTG